MRAVIPAEAESPRAKKAPDSYESGAFCIEIMCQTGLFLLFAIYKASAILPASASSATAPTAIITSRGRPAPSLPSAPFKPSLPLAPSRPSLPSAPGSPVGTVLAVLAVRAGVALIPFITFIALVSACRNAERFPCRAAVVGDIPYPVFADTEYGRYARFALFAACAVPAGFSRVSRLSSVTPSRSSVPNCPCVFRPPSQTLP